MNAAKLPHNRIKQVSLNGLYVIDLLMAKVVQADDGNFAYSPRFDVFEE